MKRRMTRMPQKLLVDHQCARQRDRQSRRRNERLFEIYYNGGQPSFSFIRI